MNISNFIKKNLHKPTKWDYYFMNLAKLSASMSKDPSTKVGASIMAPDKSVLSVGYNGLPPDMEDTEDILNNREVKYKYIIHAERNAVNFALRKHISDGCTLYTTLIPCEECYELIRNNKIKKIVSLIPDNDYIERYGKQWTNVIEKSILDSCSFYFLDDHSLHSSQIYIK